MAHSANRDLYRILGVRENASVEEIKSAFHRLVLRYHPDVRQGTDAEARFKEINEAYSVLADPEKRKQYDARVSRGVTPPRQGHRASRAQYAHRPRATTGTASGRFSNAREPWTLNGGSPHGLVVDLNLGVADLSAGLRILDHLIAGLDRVLSSADRVGSERRPRSGARTRKDTNG